MTELQFGATGTARMDVDCANHVGAPYPNLKIRLKDVPEMGYFAHHDPPTGEICFKGT